MIDKNYPTPKTIAEGVRKGAKTYFDNSKKGKGTPDTVVKRVTKVKIK